MKNILIKISMKQPSLEKHSVGDTHPKTPKNSSINKCEIITRKPNFIEEIPSPSFLGSMSVEASILLPVFLFFFLNLLSIIEIYNLHGTLCAALCEVGNDLSVYAYTYDSFIEPTEHDGIGGFIGNVAISYLYVKHKVEEWMGEDYLKKAPLKEGADSLIYVDTAIMQAGDVIDLVVSYQVTPFNSFIGFQKAWFYNRYYGRAWTGYDVASGDSTGTNNLTEYVYVTEYAQVYHLDRNCTYISLRIAEHMIENINNLRNEEGKRYSPCRLCIIGNERTVYITVAGDKYHKNMDCSGLQRTVMLISKGEAEKSYRSCSRCGE